MVGIATVAAGWLLRGVLGVIGHTESAFENMDDAVWRQRRRLAGSCSGFALAILLCRRLVPGLLTMAGLPEFLVLIFSAIMLLVAVGTARCVREEECLSTEVGNSPAMVGIYSLALYFSEQIADACLVFYIHRRNRSLV
ncbi:hypothetical protein BX661DRAFT_176050 [Kickxella alabastrina]|uniref:uncharacterized protein n=1 Tax=Kickxella alabastrina TaxID=61397 RepID=UPI00221FE3A0|nr:uncharacterized protein BX661DRAFT_176047 [Kickxella alabastrina]XP_051395467.1 uncharacterized protein BX661DRAFT_176050 [Kickxella alabastrina]KAI7835077.1 hypothetical protein BX661DRAFT_176047 [Kickxella alabastrina]KAI7835079.1 hypothetical protein BX661DRAFT_176050 [Kickxella alabastrina]